MLRSITLYQQVELGFCLYWSFVNRGSKIFFSFCGGMDKHGLVVVLLFVFMIGLGRGYALNSRKLVTTPDPNGSSNGNQDSPLSSPPPDEKKQNPSPVVKPKDAPIKTPSDNESKGINDANTKKSSENSSDKTQDKGKSHDVKEKVENQKQLETFANKYCKGNPFCSDQETTMVACIQDIENGTNKVTLLVQNERDKPMKVNVTLGTFMNESLPAFDIAAHEKVNFTLSGDKSTKVILNARNGDCELLIDGPKTIPINDPSKSKNDDNTHKLKDVENPADSPVKPKDKDNPTKFKDSDNAAKDDTAADAAKAKEEEDAAKAKEEEDAAKAKAAAAADAAKVKEEEDAAKAAKDVETPISQNNLFDQLTFYSKQVTPIYGAYFAFLVALVIGGSWAMCSFRKRRTNGGVPYQELEMGLPESSNAINVETSEGWDQDWDDDDWDEDKAIRSPGARTISSNGLTSRKKDGWDADWEN